MNTGTHSVGRVLAGSLLLVALDQVTKSILPQTRTSFVQVAPNRTTMFALVGFRGVVLMVLSATVAVLVGTYAFGLWRERRLSIVALCLVLAGFMGNLSDRALFGYVRDRLVIGSSVWNIADGYLLVSLPWLLVAALSVTRRTTDRGR